MPLPSRLVSSSSSKTIRAFETKTNYMLCQIEDHTSTDLKYYLVHEHGILIRDCHNVTGLSNHFFRVATQRPDENDALVDAIRQFLNLQNPKE